MNKITKTAIFLEINVMLYPEGKPMANDFSQCIDRIAQNWSNRHAQDAHGNSGLVEYAQQTRGQPQTYT